MTTDVNMELEMFTSPPVVFLYRVVIAGCCFAIAFYSLVLILKRHQNQHLTKVHRNVLILNLVTMSILGFVEAVGNKWIGGSFFIRCRHLFFLFILLWNYIIR